MLHGDPVDASVRWRTPDPAVIDVDSTTGQTTGLIVSDTARVQALVGSKDPLISDFLTLVVTPLADTLIQSSAGRVTVDPNATSSGALLMTISRKPAAPIKSFPLVYRVIEPVFVASDDRTVEFRLAAPAPYFMSVMNRPDGGPQPRHAIEAAGGKLTVTPCSSATGAPLAAPQLNRRANRTQPDSVIVEVTAQHPDGSAVPGSGQRFTVIFKKQP